MAIVYNFSKTLDTHVIEVSQLTVYELYYLSDNSNSLVTTVSLLIDTPVVVPTVKDGHYKLVLIVEEETDVEIEFYVNKYLQDSIIRDVNTMLCGLDANCADAIITADCLKTVAKKCLSHKAIFVKLLSFQTLVVPTYGINYSLIFANFLENGALTYNCKIQTTINAIVMEECITGSVKNVDKLSNLFYALYWAGMYFIEENLAGEDADQLAFIKTKFKYDCIVACLCNTCIDIDDLRDVFEVDADLSEITLFQYDQLAYDVDDIALLTPAYLAMHGTVYEEDALLAGLTHTFTYIGRLGFVITNTTPNKYSIYDILNNDITTTVFDRVYDSGTLTEYYVSKEFYVPSDVYFKLILN